MAPNELTRWALIEDHDLLDVYRGRTIITGSPRLDTSLTMSQEDRKALRGRLGMAEGDERRTGPVRPHLARRSQQTGAGP